MLYEVITDDDLLFSPPGVAENSPGLAHAPFELVLLGEVNLEGVVELLDFGLQFAVSAALPAPASVQQLELLQAQLFGIEADLADRFDLVLDGLFLNLDRLAEGIESYNFV